MEYERLPGLAQQFGWTSSRRRVIQVTGSVALGSGVAGLWSRARAAQEATPAASPEPGFLSLFDGTEDSFAQWHVVGADGFDLVDGAIVAQAGDDLGLLYYTPRAFADFVLRLEFRITELEDNSGVFVRFRDPGQPLPSSQLATPGAEQTYPNRDLYTENGAWVAIDTGFEVQIDEAALGNPMDEGDDGQDQFRTGAIYDMPVGDDPGEQVFQRGPAVLPNEWHDLEIAVAGDTYTVRLDGEQTAHFTNVDPFRGRSLIDDPASGFIGIQSHPFTAGHVDFRNIRVREETSPTTSESATPIS